MLKRLKLATIFMPPAVAWFYETLRHTFFSYQLQQDWWGNLLAALFVFSISFTFAQVVFTLVARMQTRLVSQNRQLRDLNQQIKVMAVTEERSRLSREMHDGLAQLLAYSMMKVDLVETLIQTGHQTEALKELELVRKACDDGYNDVREAITGLRADLLDGRDFLTIIGEVLNNFSDTNPVAVEFNRYGFEAKEDYRELILPIWTLQLVRVVQEALSNIRKHAGATRVSVSIELKPAPRRVNTAFAADSGGNSASQLTGLTSPTLPQIEDMPTLFLEISDNGKGFSHLKQKETNRGHFGLIIMRERIESLGGKFEYGNRTENEKGAYITVALPIKPEVTSGTDMLITRSDLVA